MFSRIFWVCVHPHKTYTILKNIQFATSQFLFGVNWTILNEVMTIFVREGSILLWEQLLPAAESLDLPYRQKGVMLDIDL